MKIKESLYYCVNCKKISKKLDDFLFVTDNSSFPFCSEKCIEEYYAPIVGHYERVEDKLRKDYGLDKEDCLKVVEGPEYMESALQTPDEVWCLENDLGERIYSFISYFEESSGSPVNLMILCLVNEHRPSFIISATATRDERLLGNYKIGEQESKAELFHVVAGEEEVVLNIDQATISVLESKKATILAELLDSRKESDIGYENFHLYEGFYQATLESPDEVYRFKDSEGDDIFTYVKAHDREGIPFFMFVLCTPGEIGGTESGKSLLPIIFFPTLDGDLYQKYKKGELISGGLKN